MSTYSTVKYCGNTDHVLLISQGSVCVQHFKYAKLCTLKFAFADYLSCSIYLQFSALCFIIFISTTVSSCQLLFVRQSFRRVFICIFSLYVDLVVQPLYSVLMQIFTCCLVLYCNCTCKLCILCGEWNIVNMRDICN